VGSVRAECVECQVGVLRARLWWPAWSEDVLRRGDQLVVEMFTEHAGAGRFGSSRLGFPSPPSTSGSERDLAYWLTAPSLV
jgi:hypothetical protein